MTNTALLYKTISAKGIKIKKIVEAADMTYPSFYRKANNESEFRASEIIAISAVLGIDSKLRDLIFFAKDVA